MYSPPLFFLLFSFADWPHGQCNQANLYKAGFPWRVNRAETRFFVTGRISSSAEGTRLVVGSRGVLPQKSFKFGGSETVFLALVMRYVSEKIDLEPENGKQLQVTIIKITESKENNSIHRLDESGSTGPGGSAPLASPLATGLVKLTHG